MMDKLARAATMARGAGFDPKAFRRALRQTAKQEGWTWHQHNGPWEAIIDSEQHKQMIAVLSALKNGRGR